MTNNLSNLVLLIIEENFSSEVSKICSCLLENGEMTLLELCKQTKFEFCLVRDSLIILIQNKLLKLSTNKKKDSLDNVYSLDLPSCMTYLRHPKILFFINENYGSLSKNIVEVLLLHGIMTYSQIKEVIENNYDSNHNHELRKMFNTLIVNSLVVQAEKINPEAVLSSTKENEYGQLMSKFDKNKFETDPLTKESLNSNSMILNGKMKNSGKKNGKRAKKGIIDYEENGNSNANNEMIIEDDCEFIKNDSQENYFTLNHDKFNSIFTCESIYEVIAKVQNLQTAQVAQLFIQAAGFDKARIRTNSPFSVKELLTTHKNLGSTSENLNYLLANPNQVEEVIKQARLDDLGLFKISGDKEGNKTYIVDFEGIYKSLKIKLREKVVEQLLSPIHSRVFRLISKSGPLDIKNVMDICMVPQKECCLCLNQLVKLCFLEVQELNIKGSNQIFFKATTDMNDLSLKSMIYKIIFNLKTLARNKRSEEIYHLKDSANANLAKIYSLISELDKYLIYLN